MYSLLKFKKNLRILIVVQLKEMILKLINFKVKNLPDF